MASKRSGPTQLNSKDSLSQTGSSSARSKVALKPGRSLMDWIRLTHSGKDLTSTGGKTFDVSAEELSKHNKKEDAWICLKGKVYNITPYLEYHPGGEDELMRGAGRDATDLFNQIHKWVNAESMLQKCFIGRIKMSSLWLQKATAFPAPKFPAPNSKTQGDKLNSLPGSNNVGTIQMSNCKLPEETEKQVPKFDWFQTSTSVSLVIYSRWKKIKQEHIIVDLVARDLEITLHVEKYTYQLHMELEGAVLCNCEVKIGQGSGAVEFFFLKESSEELWPDLGTPLLGHNTFTKMEERDIRYRPCKLTSKTSVTYNTYLLTFNFPSGTRMLVPLGHHVHVKSCVNEMDITRSYTPVVESFDISTDHASIIEGNLLYLMIKIYPEGALTPAINQCKVGETVFISDYVGDFREDKLQECSLLMMLAAGTGFTPMVRLIHWALRVDKNNDRALQLVFFNKTEQDILWKDELHSLSKEYERFQIHHVLSEPSDDWTGTRGRITEQLLEEIFPPVDEYTKLLICVCGPLTFTKTALEYLEELGYSQDNIHAFLG